MTRATPSPFHELRETTHRGDDDLLSAGLGAAGLRSAMPPAVLDPDRPSGAEQRRRAIWSNWRGIADLATALAAPLPSVPGCEFHALARLPGARHPHRVMLQLPDELDSGLRCLIVTAASGSRGIYGAQAVASHWALPRGIPVVATDKGAGCDWFDGATGVGFGIDGCPTGDAARLAFAPERAAAAAGPWVAIRHAHSGDNPEADWGRHLRQAAEFGLETMTRALPRQPPFRFDNTRVIAVGLSNAGAAVLRAAEDPAPWLAAAVAAAPNVWAPDGGRALYDYATEAAIWMPAAQAAAALADMPSIAPLLGDDLLARRRAAAIAELQHAGLLPDGSPQRAAGQALARLREAGWTDAALHAAVLSSAFEMWRAVGVAYSSAYGRFGVGAHPLGFGYSMLDDSGAPRAPGAAERARWWSDGAGIVPGEGVEIVDPSMADPLSSLRRLQALPLQDDEAGRRVRLGQQATRAALPRRGLPVLVLHGVDDGLIPERFSSGAWVQACRQAGLDPGYWRLPGVQHFDSFLALPDFGARYAPLLPLLHEALDAMFAHVMHGGSAPGDRDAVAAD